MSLPDSTVMLTTVASSRKDTSLMPYLGPDSKSRVTVEYDQENRPVRIDTIVISTQHDEGVEQEQIKRDIETHLIPEIIPGEWMDRDTKLIVNPTGKFEIGRASCRERV